MASVIAYSKQLVSSGVYDDSATNYKTPGIFGSPGSGSQSHGYYRCDIYLHMALMDDGTLWMAPGGGTVSSAEKVGDNRDNWTPCLYASPNNFEVYVPQSSTAFTVVLDPSTNSTLIFDGCVSSNKSGGSTGPVSYTIADAGSVSVGASSLPSAYKKVTPKITNSGDTKKAEIYVCGVVKYVSPPNNDSARMPSVLLTITGQEIIDKLFDYYPWGRHNNTEYISCNAAGHSLKRYTSATTTTDVKNTYGTGTNKGQRYNGSSWVKSPITGKE